MYEQCMKRARQAAHKAYDRNGRTVERSELIAEAYLVMTEALLTWDPERGRSQESWVGYLVNRELKKKCAQSSVVFDHDDIDDFSSEQVLRGAREDPESVLLTKEKHELRRNSLSSTAQEVLSILAENCAIPDKKNEAKRIVREHLREEGVAWNKIKSAFKELREVTAQI